MALQLDRRRTADLPHHARFSGWTACLALLALAAVVFPSSRTVSAETGAIRIEQPWSRATPAGAAVGAGYLRIINTGKLADRLVSGATPIAERLEIHEMTMADGVMRMRPLAAGLEIPAGATVELKPGGYHLMFVGLKAPVAEGKPFTAKLRFATAGDIDVTFAVEKAGTRSPSTGQHPQPGHSGGGHGHH